MRPAPDASFFRGIQRLVDEIRHTLETGSGVFERARGVRVFGLVLDLVEAAREVVEIAGEPFELAGFGHS